MRGALSDWVVVLVALLVIAALPAGVAGCTVGKTAVGKTTAGEVVEAKCLPGGPCSKPIEIRIVLVTMFEIGEDEGDTAGEFQLWKERRGLTTRIPFPQSHHDLYLNPKTGVLAMVTGIGTAKSATATMALGLDPRFDLRQAYWLVAGIAGIDPADASIGSAVWSAHLVDGDLGHEIDPREIPEDWETGYFARYTRFPYDPDKPEPTGELFVTNIGLRDWAFELTRNTPLPDLPGLAASRDKYTETEPARRPPFVMVGGHLAGMTFWHGAILNQWANRWVDYWTDGQSGFVTSAMEETGTFQAIEYLDRVGRVDRDRFMVLRAGSNYTMPPPGVTAADNLLAENEGYAGLQAAVESLYLVGSVVVDELLKGWERYATEVPGSSTGPAGAG